MTLAERCCLLPAAATVPSQVSTSGGRTCSGGSGSEARPTSLNTTVKHFPLSPLAQRCAPPPQ